MRFELKQGKYGHYYYDNRIMIDMTLEMILRRLNNTEKIREQNNFLIDLVHKLENKITLLKEIKND